MATTLLLPARQLGRICIPLIRKAHSLQEGHGLLFGFFLGDLSDFDWRQGNVFDGRQVRVKVKLLEYEAYFRTQLIDVRFFCLKDPGRQQSVFLSESAPVY